MLCSIRLWCVKIKGQLLFCALMLPWDIAYKDKIVHCYFMGHWNLCTNMKTLYQLNLNPNKTFITTFEPQDSKNHYIIYLWHCCTNETQVTYNFIDHTLYKTHTKLQFWYIDMWTNDNTIHLWHIKWDTQNMTKWQYHHQPTWPCHNLTTWKHSL